MIADVRPVLLDTDPYATAEQILATQDLPEVDVKITRWTASGKPLKLRVRGLDLPTQDKIQQAALVKNPKTGLWERSDVLFAIETLQHIIRVPGIDQGTARAMLQKNPMVINALVDFGWGLVAFTDEMLEKAAHALLPPDADAAALAEPGAAAEPIDE
jgi:hypothetical protein